MVEYTALKKPLGCTVVMGFASKIMIGGWVRGRKPTEKTFSELVPCEKV